MAFLFMRWAIVCMESIPSGKDTSEVIDMSEMNNKFNGLFDLIDNDDESNEFFSSLPSYVKDAIGQRAENIRSRDALYTYADNLLQGDD